MASALRGPTRLASRLGRSLRRLLDRDQTQGERLAAFAFYPNRPIDQPAGRRLAQLGDKVERLAVTIEPACALPAGPDHDVRAGFDHARHAVRLQIGTIAKADLARNHRYPVERLALLLIGEFEVAKAFLRKIEGAVNAPQLVLPSGASSVLRHRGGVNDADDPAAAPLGSGGSKPLTHQQREPVPALTQAIQQRHAGNIDK